MSFHNHTPMHDIVTPILLMGTEYEVPLVRRSGEGWQLRQLPNNTCDEWMPVTFAPTAEVLDKMLSHGEIAIDEDQVVRLVPGPWGLGKDGRAGGIA
jgi:hypothetical protein